MKELRKQFVCPKCGKHLNIVFHSHVIEAYEKIYLDSEGNLEYGDPTYGSSMKNMFSCSKSDCSFASETIEAFTIETMCEVAIQ